MRPLCHCYGNGFDDNREGEGDVAFSSGWEMSV